MVPALQGLVRRLRRSLFGTPLPEAPTLVGQRSWTHLSQPALGCWTIAPLPLHVPEQLN